MTRLGTAIMAIMKMTVTSIMDKLYHPFWAYQAKWANALLTPSFSAS